MKRTFLILSSYRFLKNQFVNKKGGFNVRPTILLHFEINTHFYLCQLPHVMSILQKQDIAFMMSYLVYHSSGVFVNIQQLSVLPTLYLCVLYLSENK